MNSVKEWRGSLFRYASLAALAICCAACAPAQTTASGPSVTLVNRDAIVYSAATGKVYAVDKAHNAVLVIGANGVAKSVKVGDGPEAIAVNPVTGMAYVASSAAANVSVLDGKTDEVVATIRTAARPYAIAVDELANEVYVSNTFSNMLTVIDGATNTASNVKTGSADAIVVDAAAKKIYLLGYESDTLTVWNTANGAIAKIPAGAMHLWGIALDKAAGKLYVTHVTAGSIAALDVKTHREVTIPVGSIPSAVAVADTTGMVYVADYNDGHVTVVNGTEGRVVATVPVGQHPQAIAVDHTAGLIFVANTKDGTVSFIDGKTHRVRKTVKAGEHPYAIAVDEKTQKVYVANLGEKAFTELAAR